MQRKHTANVVCANQASHASNSTSTVNTPDAGQQMLHVQLFCQNLLSSGDFDTDLQMLHSKIQTSDQQQK